MNVGNDAIEYATGVRRSAVWNHTRLVLIAGFLASLLVAINLSWGKSAAANGSATPSQANWAELYANLPMSFEVNRGQAAGAVKYLARGQGYTLYLTGDEAVLT